MTAVVPQVFAYFGLEYGPTAPYFVIGDPVRGIIGNSTYKIAPAVGDPTDIATDGFAISINRGRSRETDEISPGTASLNFYNFSRQYDPFNTAGAYYGNITPGKKITVRIYGQTIFDGTIDDWDVNWQVSLGDSATISAIDGLGDLARREFLEWNTTGAELAGARINAVLNRPEVAAGTNRDVDAGQSVLDTDLVTWGSEVLNYLQLVARSDLGRFFVSREGVFTFRDRHSLYGASVDVTFVDGSFDGTAARTPFHGIEMAVGSDFLYNRVGIDRVDLAGILQTSEDSASQMAYGTRSLSLTGLLQNTDAQTASMAQYLLNLYKDPTARISAVAVQVDSLSEVQQMAICALDIGSLVEVSWTPRGSGSLVDQVLVVDGISHDLAPDAHNVTLRLSPAAQSGVFIIGDPIWGVINGPGRIAF